MAGMFNHSARRAKQCEQPLMGPLPRLHADMMAARARQLQPARMGGVRQREADLLPLRWAVQRAASPAARAAAEAKLQVAVC